MKAQEFWLKFKELFSEGSDSLKTARKYWKKPRDFTNEFINKYIPYIIKEQNDIAEFEYFRIDIISYSQRKDEAEAYPYDGELTPYLWDLKVAFEHENNNKEWLEKNCFHKSVNGFCIYCRIFYDISYSEYHITGILYGNDRLGFAYSEY